MILIIFASFFFFFYNQVFTLQACLRKTTPRSGEKNITVKCLENEETIGRYCLPKCIPGYETIGIRTCRASCPVNFTDSIDSEACGKPPTYGRGGGYPWLFGDPLDSSGMFKRCEKDNGKGNCEQWDLIVYPKCKTNFVNIACCLCGPVCPPNTIEKNGQCSKQSYDRGIGVSRIHCPKPKEFDIEYCYDKCKGKDKGFGKMCWGTCSSTFSFDCGIFCTKDIANCYELVDEFAKSSIDGTIIPNGFNITNYNTITNIVKLSESIFNDSTYRLIKFGNFESCSV